MSVGNSSQASQLLVRDPICARALGCDDSIGDLVARALSHGDRRHGRALVDDLVGFETLLDVLGEFLGNLGVACYVEDEEIFGCLFSNDTTADSVSIFSPSNIEEQYRTLELSHHSALEDHPRPL